MRSHCRLCDSKLKQNVVRTIQEGAAVFHHTACPHCGELNLIDVTSTDIRRLEQEARGTFEAKKKKELQADIEEIKQELAAGHSISIDDLEEDK